MNEESRKKDKLQAPLSPKITLFFLRKYEIFLLRQGFPGGAEVKASASNAGDPGSIPGSGRSPGEGNGNPLQDSCLENSMDGGAWQATIHGVAKSQIRLSDITCFHFQTNFTTNAKLTSLGRKH